MAKVPQPRLMQVPPALKPGDRIRVVAPSGPFEDETLERGLKRLSDFDVVVPEKLWGRRTGFLAGDDATRLFELQAALDAEDTAGVWIARGGYGMSRLLPHLNFDGLGRTPKWIVGFSDVTSLHCALGNQSIASLHALNGTTLERALASDLDLTLRVLQGKDTILLEGLEPWSDGSAHGTLWGGNLTVLFAEAAAGRLCVPDGAVVFMEDVSETSYRIDRMLNALVTGGYLRRVAAVILGDFVDCSPGKFEVSAGDVLREHLVPLNVPLLAGVPAGHGERNVPLLLGGVAHVEASSGTVTIARP